MHRPTKLQAVGRLALADRVYEEIFASIVDGRLVAGAGIRLSAGLTQFMSNTASTALLAPIGLSIAVGIGASPYAVLMAIAVSASCAFFKPVASHRTLWSSGLADTSSWTTWRLAPPW